MLVDREGLGDVLLKFSFLRAIASGFPKQPIWWIARHQSAMAGPLRRFMPVKLAEVREHVGIGGPTGEVKRQLLALPPFSLVFDTRTRIASVWLAHRYLTWDRFYCCLPGYLLSSARPPGRCIRHRHIGKRALSLAEAALRAPADGSGRLMCTQAARTVASKILPDGPIYVGLAVGSREMRKNWPINRFTALAVCLGESGIVPVVFLGPHERDYAAFIRRVFPRLLAIDFTQFPGEDDGLDVAIAIAERVALVVANDSGMGHLFGAAGRPIISLFGPTDPRRWAPMAPLQRTVRAQDFHGEAMDLIPLAAVLRAVQDLIPASKSLLPISPA